MLPDHGIDWDGKAGLGRTLLQDCQSHWKGRAVGSFSTSSMSSISVCLILFLTFVRFPKERSGGDTIYGRGNKVTGIIE
jgi:pyruvate dehydrogenase complex dehydrogenase (E1) component